MLKKILQRDCRQSSWSGGITRQIAIFPADAVYSERKFLWRISSASVAIAHTEFTALPEYDRQISVLKGKMTLKTEGKDPVRLEPGKVYAFDGGEKIRSEGICTDFNLMLRKGRAEGELFWAFASGAEQVFGIELRPKETLLVYMAEKSGKLVSQDGTLSLEEGESALFTASWECRADLRLSEKAKAVLAVVSTTEAAAEENHGN